MQIKTILFAIAILLFSFFLACQSESTEKRPQENIKVKINPFNADSAYAYVAKQVDFGNRYMNTEEHEQCKNWLASQLGNFGFEVIPQTFTATAYNGKIVNGTNIIGRYKPEVKERLLLCAHYDTRHIAEKDSINPDAPILGADDGASGVGVLLEIARQVKNNPIPMGLDIIFFDAEDYGSNEKGQDYTWGLGSQYWSKNIHEKNYQVKFGILVDMVGSSDATFPKEGFSLQSAKSEVAKIWRLAQKMGQDKYFVSRKAGFYTDDHRFIIENTGIKMLDIINIKKDGKFGHYHHTHKDDLSIIDKKTLKAVGQVLLAVVCKESNQEKY